MDASASSSNDTTTNVGQFHRASSMKILSFHHYKKWIAHEVASLLCMKKLDGGASLAVEKARTLYNAGFDGTSLANIVQDIRKHNDKHALEKLLNKAKDNTGMINPCLSDTCTTIVNWVNNLLIPKLFGLWDSALCKQKLIGGAGLLEDRVQPLYQAGFNGTFLLRIVYELEKNEQNGSALTDVDLVNKTLRMEIDSSTCTALMEWVRVDLIAKNKIQIPLVFIEQPSINGLPFGFLDDPFTWLETFLSVDLKQCFETKLEQRYEPPSGTMKGFYNRDDFKFKVKQLVKANITHFHKNKIAAIDRKNSFKYGIMSNGTGNGKTRACNEVQNIIMDMDINEIGDKNNTGLHYRKLHTYMTLDNGSYLTSVEVESDPLKEITEGKIIGLRILAKILGMNILALVNELGHWFKPIYTKSNFFTIQNIAKKFKKFLKDNEILIWSISVDAVHHLFRIFREKWKLPLYSIGSFMVNTEQLNQNLGNNICFIPILSGIMYEELAFKAPEYGNQEFFLPPLSPSNLHDILKDVFRGKTFLCKTSMLDMLEIETTEIVRSMGIMLLEALVIPEVLTLTLNKIISFMKSITFDTWKQSSSTLFPNLKEQVDEEVSQYLRQETKFTNHTFQKSLVARLLCGLSLPLTNEEQDLFKLGKIYLTENGRLYIAPHYFQLVIRADSYIAVKLPKTKLEIDPRYFERIDLKCLCYRIFMLQQRGNFLITIEQLFPSCVTGVDKDYLFTLPATTEMFKVVDLTETFITKGSDVAQYDIDCSKCRKQFSEVYSYTLSTHPCVNAHFWLQTSLHNRTSLFLIQHRNYDSCLNVVDWLNTNNFADNAFEKFGKQEIDVYFVMISTSTISQEQLEKLKNHKHFQRTILISHHSSREEYFPTNLLPYYKAFVFYKDQHDNQELEHQQDPRAVL